MTPPGDRRGTISWKLQRELILLLAWGPAVLLQVAHPLIAQGVADHSSFRNARWGRLRRLRATLHAMLGLCFGSEEDARVVVARINAIHDRVHGRLPVAAGRFAAATGYSAHDPALLAWVHISLLEMNLRVYELFVAPLTLDDKDRYCAEASTIETAFGIPTGRLPRSVGELRRDVDTMLASGDLVVADVARRLARDLLDPPAPVIARPGLRWMRLVTIGLLPPAIRAAYGFAWDRRHERLLRGSARVSRAMLPFVPSVLRVWPAARRSATASGCPWFRWPRRAPVPTDGLG